MWDPLTFSFVYVVSCQYDLVSWLEAVCPHDHCIYVFTTSSLSWFTASFPTHFQLFDMHLYLDVHWFLKTLISWSGPCFIAHRPVCCPFGYVTEDVIQQFLRLKYVTYSLVCSDRIFSKETCIVNSFFIYFFIKLCPLGIPLGISALWFRLTACLLGYRNSFAINITLFSLVPSKSD